jgi:hypothetical protein
MQKFAPVALFVYNRPEHTRRTLKFLAANNLADESRLFIFSDGPKTSRDQQLVEEVRNIVKNSSGFKSVDLIFRPQNLGLAASVISGVTDLVNTYGSVIVFEDDLISSPYTLQYFNDALNRFQDNEKVMHIGAYMYPLQPESLPQTFFYRITTSWGWATWKRSWDQFEPDIDVLMAKFNRQKINDFSIDGAMNFWKQMRDFKAGRNNSWAIRWYASVFLAGGTALHPAHSLINNIGHDGSGVHSGSHDLYHVSVNPLPVTQFPEAVKEIPPVHEAIRSFLRHRKGSFVQRALRFLREKIRK